MSRALPAAVFIVAFGLLAARAYPTLAPLDSGELAAVGATLGVAHPPGYPLFSLAGRAWSALLALGNPAYRMNLFSAAASAAALAALAAAFAEAGWAAALAAALTLLLVPSFQREALATEVFALNTLFAALLVFLARTPVPNAWLLGAFLLGLGLGNQHTLLLCVPLLIPPLPNGERVRVRGLRPFFLAAVLFFVGLSVYLFIYLRSLQSPALNWEEPSTLERFWGLLTRARYGTLALAQGGSAAPWEAQRVVGSLRLYFTLLWDSLGWLQLPALAGLAALWHRNRRFALGTLAAWALSGPAFFVLSKMQPGPNALTVMERFLPLSALFLAAWVGEAAAALPRRWSPWMLAAFLPASPWLAADARASFTTADLLRSHLRTLPERAVLLADRADEVEFGMAYLHFAEGRRPGLQFVDCNAGVTPSIYGTDYYGVWGPPRLRRREQVELALIANSQIPVYYATQEPKQVNIPKEREGVLWRASGPAHRTTWPDLYALRWSWDATRRERVLAWSHHRLLAEDALERGDFGAAELSFRGAGLLAGDPALEDHWAGVSFYERGRYPEAARLLERSLARREDALAYRNLGVTCWKLGRWDCAARAFERAAALDPSDSASRQDAQAAWARLKR